MESTEFTPGQILKTIFLYVEKKPNDLASYYLYCDRTLLYKWMRDSVALPKKHVNTIVRFTLENTQPSQRKEIQNALKAPLSFSPLSSEARTLLVETEDFGDFLHEAFLQAITLKLTGQLGGKQQKGGVDGSAPRTAPRSGIEFRLIVCGILAAVTGGVLWAVINHLFGLEHYMGGSGHEPTGILSLIWGVLVGMPVIFFALVAASAKGSSKGSPETEAQASPDRNALKKVHVVILYSLLSGLGAFVFYNSGFRVYLEDFHLSYGVQEMVIAAVYALILSVLPLLALLVLRKQLHMPWWFIPSGALFCSVFSALTALSTLLVGRPEMEVSQLRGFIVAVVLRLSLFVLTYLFISDRLWPLERLIPRPHKAAGKANQ